MSFLAQIRSLLFCVRMVGHAAGCACVIVCDSRSPDAFGVDLGWHRCSGYVLNRVVQRALRSCRHMSFDSSLSASAAAFAVDALETLAVRRSPRPYIGASAVGGYRGRRRSKRLRYLLLDLPG